MNCEKLFDEVYSYCSQGGYIELLNESLRSSESERFNSRDIDKFGLDVLDVIHCLVDKNRTRLFLREIERIVKCDDKVLEAGIGTGILSFAACQLGAEVCGIELNPQVLELAEDISNYLQKRGRPNLIKAEFLREDAIRHHSPNQLDVIISENIYTGMFYEKQIQIMNNLTRYLKPGGKVIPSGMRSGLALVEMQVPVAENDCRFFVVNELSSGKIYRELSNSVEYSSFNFECKNEEIIDSQIRLKVTESGTANALMIWSEVLMYGGRKIHRSDTDFLNNDIILRFPNEKRLTIGEEIEFSLRYRCGCNPESVEVLFN